MPGLERYRLLMKHIADHRSMWIVESHDHVLTLRSAEDKELLPVWPTDWFAEASLTESDKEAGYKPTVRNLDAWINVTTPALIQEGVQVGAFPNAKMECPAVDARLFRKHLLESLSPDQLQAAELRKIHDKVRRKSSKPEES